MVPQPHSFRRPLPLFLWIYSEIMDCQKTDRDTTACCGSLSHFKSKLQEYITRNHCECKSAKSRIFTWRLVLGLVG